VQIKVDCNENYCLKKIMRKNIFEKLKLKFSKEMVLSFI